MKQQKMRRITGKKTNKQRIIIDLKNKTESATILWPLFTINLAFFLDLGFFWAIK